ncbi:MAG TPA: CoA transferase [Acidimicrobiales bacterium]|nr:CoA transferase [Acidimicrobiales bacterium]
MSADALRQLWTAVDGDASLLGEVSFAGPQHALASTFRVTDVSAAVVGALGLAASEHLAARTGRAPRPVAVDRLHAALACRSERYLTADADLSWPDPLTGDHRCADGWIRIHTVYPHHRAAACRVLRVAEERGAFVAAIRERSGEEVQEAVVAAGGAAAVMRTRDDWSVHPHGSQVRSLPLVYIHPPGAAGPEGASPASSHALRPLHGVRVLDLTRVIAGPTAAKMLAALGAEVLRVEPPGFAEVPVVSVDTGFGKRAAVLDLRSGDDRAAFEALVARADVVVHGFRPGSLARLGLGDDDLHRLRPGLVTGSLSAWGSAGPWATRRGFDSLVQMASGIAAEGMVAAGTDRPTPLPMQLLDHATAYLLALGVVRALTERRSDGRGRSVRVSLARTAAWIDDLGRVDRESGLAVAEPGPAVVEPYLALFETSPWGRVRHVRPAFELDGVETGWLTPPQRPGSSPAEWAPRQPAR